MGISLKDHRRKRRRGSYADYRPPRRSSGPGNDPFRIVFYLVMIAAGLWIYFNQQTARAALTALVNDESVSSLAELMQGRPAESLPGVDAPPTPDVSHEETASRAAEAMSAGDYEEAIALYLEAGELNPELVDYHVQVARLSLFSSYFVAGQARDGLLAQAEEAADRAILADPFGPAGYSILGKVQDWNGAPDEAISTLLRATEADPEYAPGLSYYAEALADLDRWDQATETINRALELAPNDVDVRRDYAYILETLGDYNSAVTQYEAALAIDPNQRYIQLALARVYRTIDRYDESLELLFDLSVLVPDSPVVQYEIGRTYETFIGDPNSALAYFEKAVELDETYAIAWIRVGTIRYYQGEYVLAIPPFERAVALGETDNVDLYLQLGMAYALTGQCGNAQQRLAAALQLAPDSERVVSVVQEGYASCGLPTPLPAPTATPEP